LTFPIDRIVLEKLKESDGARFSISWNWLPPLNL
jgi:hypothetical protein